MPSKVSDIKVEGQRSHSRRHSGGVSDVIVRGVSDVIVEEIVMS